MATRTKDNALPSMAGEATATNAASNEALGITAEVAAQIARAEADQLARWKAEPMASITVPRGITLSPSLKVIVNGVSWSLPIGVETKAPASVVAIARARIDQSVNQENAARARSSGG